MHIHCVGSVVALPLGNTYFPIWFLASSRVQRRRRRHAPAALARTVSFQHTRSGSSLAGSFHLGEDEMALSKQLLDQNLTFQCPSCKTPLVRKGSWVKSVTTFT